MEIHPEFVENQKVCLSHLFQNGGCQNFQELGAMCAGLDLKDAFLYVPIDAKVKKILRFKEKGKLYECQVLPFGLKCFPQILTFMVKPIVRFLRGRGISLTAYIGNFTNQASCRCKAIFHVHVIALVFMCCGWSIN